jgi:hypothetical protein
MPEETALGTRVRVVVVRDVPHVVVDVVLELEMVRDDRRESLVHMGEMLCGRCDAVPAPHDHRNRTYLTLRDPTDVVLVEPGCDACRFAQITIFGAIEMFGHTMTIRHEAASGAAAGIDRRLAYNVSG